MILKRYLQSIFRSIRLHTKLVFVVIRHVEIVCFFGFGCNSRKKKWLDQPVFDWDEADPENEENKNDPVNHPSYYTDGKIEVIDYIKDKGLGFCLGNAVKYISRAGKKDPEKEIEDLRKAAWYINRRIEELLEKENDRE